MVDAMMDRILMIVQLLAKAADRLRVSEGELIALNEQVAALAQEAGDVFVQRFLGKVKAADGVLNAGVIEQLSRFP